MRGRSNWNSPRGKIFDLNLQIVYDNRFKALFGPRKADVIIK